MPEDKSQQSAVEEFLGGLGKAPANPFESADPFAAKPVEAKSEESEEVVDEKPIPFHKDPKVLRFIEKEVSKRVGEAKPIIVDKEVTPSDVQDLVGAFTAIIGNDTPEKVAALKALEKSLQTADQRAADKAVARLQETLEQQSQAEVEADKKAQEQLDTSFEEIEESFGVDLSSNTAQAKKTRSEFVDYIRKIAPKNEDGEVAAFPDLMGAFEDFQDRQKRINPATSKAKELASRGMTRSNDTSVAPQQTTKNWKTIDKLFNNLGN